MTTTINLVWGPEPSFRRLETSDVHSWTTACGTYRVSRALATLGDTSRFVVEVRRSTLQHGGAVRVYWDFLTSEKSRANGYYPQEFRTLRAALEGALDRHRLLTRNPRAGDNAEDVVAAARRLGLHELAGVASPGLAREKTSEKPRKTTSRNQKASYNSEGGGEPRENTNDPNPSEGDPTVTTATKTALNRTQVIALLQEIGYPGVTAKTKDKELLKKLNELGNLTEAEVSAVTENARLLDSVLGALNDGAEIELEEDNDGETKAAVAKVAKAARGGDAKVAKAARVTTAALNGKAHAGTAGASAKAGKTPKAGKGGKKKGEGETAKTPRAKAPGREPAATDCFGSREGTKLAQFNTALDKTPRTIKELCEISGVEFHNMLYNHLNYTLLKKDLIVKKDGKYAAKK